MRLRNTTVLLVSLAAGLLSAVPQLAAGSDAGGVAVDQSYPAPASGRYTVRGHGWGHGRGMSQWGAQGAALQGLTHERILAFYYPGTALASATGRLRVLITADTTSDVTVLDRPGLRVRDTGTGTTYPLPSGLGASRWRLTVDTRNRNVVEYQAAGTWQRFSPGGNPTLSGEGEFSADGPVTLVLPSGEERAYRGRLRAAAPSVGSTSRDTVNVVSLDQYVRAVVPAEAYTSWQPEALQAQAVAARTYAAFERAANAGHYYDICDTSACQVYRGFEEEVDSTDAAVRATRRQILTYAGKPAFTQFSASSGGWTTDGGYPYLRAQADPYDDVAGNPNHDWSTGLRVGAIQNAYPSIGRLRRIRVTTRDGNGQWGGRVVSMALVGSKRSLSLSGDSFRARFDLRSSWFSFG